MSTPLPSTQKHKNEKMTHLAKSSLPVKCRYFLRTNQLFCFRFDIDKVIRQTYTHTCVTFRPRSTSVAGTVSNAEGFACCCRAANDEDGYRVGAGQGFELTVVAVGHLGRNATWRQSTLGLFTIVRSYVGQPVPLIPQDCPA